MTENEIAEIVLDVAFKIHRELGPGLFESVYESILAYELENVYELEIKRQYPVAIYWEGYELGIGFKPDIIVEDKVIVELKSVEALNKIYFKQVHTYLKVTHLKLGLLINFNEALLKDGIKRIVNQL